MTEPRFEAAVRVTRETCRVQARGRVGHTVREAWVAALLTALGAAIFWAIGSPKGIWLTVSTTILVLFAACAERLYAARLYASRHHGVDVLRLIFDEHGIHAISSVEDSRFAYEKITWMGCDARYLMLRLHHHVPLVIGRDEVEGGQMDALTDFLKARTGLDIRPLKS